MNTNKLNVLFSTAFLVGTLAFYSCSDAPNSHEAEVKNDVESVQQAPATAKEVAIDVTTSEITWIGTKITDKHNGTFKVKAGMFKVDANSVVGGSFDIDITSLKVSDIKNAKENEQLVMHLKSSDFFDAEKNPNAKFEITKIDPYQASADSSVKENSLRIPDPSHLVTGNLTLKGVTKTIIIPAKIVIETRSEGLFVTAKSNFNIDRTKWGMSYKSEGSVPDKFIHNKVNIGIDVKSVVSPSN
ncbi:MAG: YceI family protein [Bacteroidetes bacterium]|nr:MAG: YceI family protein [Bacteroidota bacterium]